MKWSPPFLWPGQAIEHYDLFVTNENKESVYHRVNTTFRDDVVTFTAVAEHPQAIMMCNDLNFCVSAVSRDPTKKLPSYTVVGGYIPSKLDFHSFLCSVTRKSLVYAHNWHDSDKI